MSEFVEGLLFFLSWPFHRPLSLLTLVAAVAVAGVLGPVLARRLRWGLPGTRLAILGLAIAVVPTLIARLGQRPLDWDPAAIRSCGTAVVQPWSTPLEVLNLVLLVPLAIGLTWASRRPSVGLLGVIVVAGGLEVIQAVTLLGECAAEDSLRYVIGGSVAVGLTTLANRVTDRRDATPPAPDAAS